MLMNVPALRDARRSIGRIAGQADGMRAYDQGDERTLRRRRDRLPPQWNWKPYWAWTGASIVHFHGPKYEAIRCLLN